ncbi:MAG: tRNA uridine-5-carboxymethylaminomethyl(34) synthesis GTPase MnmE [Lachnospiraceae bacterium]|nr:tRNA uridine-5-carboxymethylaminomethyl(34) synthesis GTPase MnmE [Lachnospiraceae bacterium]
MDEVLLLPMKAPKSYTAEDVVEVHCHGGQLVLRNILELIVSEGARIAEPGEFTKRAFLNGRIDLSEAESVIDVIESGNNYALRNSLKQLTGRLSEKIDGLRKEILMETAFIEAALDDPEHISLDGYYDRISEKTERILSELKKLYDSFHDGRILKDGITTVILGKPNVGKSSLLNFLSDSEKAIVTDIPGTTRDVIEERISLGELNLLVYDTAGIRVSSDPVEKLGVERAKKYGEEADLILFVLDSSLPMDDNDKELLDFINNKTAVILLNKSDLESVIREEEIEAYDHGRHPIISVSVKTGEGFEKVREVISNMFLSGELTYNDEILITNERHRALLGQAIESLKNVETSIKNEMPEDFLSIDLKDAYDLLGMVLGEQVGDDLVDEIFSKFCMGK